MASWLTSRAVLFFYKGKEYNFVEHLCENQEDSQSPTLDGLWALPAGNVKM